MNKALFLTLLLSSFLKASAQTDLLNIPVTKTDSVQDVSQYNRDVYYYYFTYRFEEDEHGNDSSALYLGSRTWFELENPEVLSGLTVPDLFFSLKLKFKPDEMISGDSFPSSGTTVVFGQVNNFGILFNYADSTIRDMEGLIQYKLEGISEWRHIQLAYPNDFTIRLYVDGELKTESNRNSSLTFTNDRLGAGLYDIPSGNQQYLYAVVDSVLLSSSAEPIVTGVNDVKKNDVQVREIRYYDLSGKMADPSRLISGCMYIRVKWYSDGYISRQKILY